jgi:hypothetical protein
MQRQPSSRLGSTVVAITTVAIFAAGVAMFVVEAADLAAVEPQPLRFDQISCQNCAIWTSRSILSKPMLYRSRRRTFHRRVPFWTLGKNNGI